MTWEGKNRRSEDSSPAIVPVLSLVGPAMPRPIDVFDPIGYRVARVATMTLGNFRLGACRFQLAGAPQRPVPRQVFRWWTASTAYMDDALSLF
jgi:hypothetical protein